MNILVPVNKSLEVKKVVSAGADELYCGINPIDWDKDYTNVASSNRREWSSANLDSFYSLKKVVDTAHDYNIPVYLTLNALYTGEQYSLMEEFLHKVNDLCIDALIVADLGLLIKIKEMNLDIKVFVSTGGTVFNSSTARFYKDFFNVKRIMLPRHLKLKEIRDITEDNTDLDFEVFIMNSGCKNIDGFCTFHHGVTEILHSHKWKFPKKLNFDRHILRFIQFLPDRLRNKLYNMPFGIDSACLLNYKIKLEEAYKKVSLKEKKNLSEKIKRAYALQYGIDTCGACSIAKFVDMNIKSLKIVGRNYSTAKKLCDIKFIKYVLDINENKSNRRNNKINNQIKRIYRKIYKVPCRELCYYQ